MDGVVAVEPAQQLQLDPIAARAEQGTTGTEQDRYQVDLQLVQLAGGQQRLGRSRAVHHDRAVPREAAGLGRAGVCVVEVPDVAGGRFRMVCQDHDRYAVVVVAVPAAGQLEGAPARDDCTGRHRLAVHLAVDPRTVTLVEPVEQPATVAAELLAGSVVGAGDEAVERHRHVEPDRSTHVDPPRYRTERTAGSRRARQGHPARADAPGWPGGSPIGLTSGSTVRVARASGSASSAKRSAVPEPARVQGSWASSSVRLSARSSRSRPVEGIRPSRPSRPGAASDSPASAHSSSVQPRWGCSASRARSWPQRSTIVDSPSRPTASWARTWPSPRSSRRTVAACQRTGSGSVGQGRAAFAAPRARPEVGALAATDWSNDAASRTSAPSRSRSNAAAEPSTRAARTTSGEASSQIDGMARSTIRGAKLANSEMDTAAGARPSGAERDAK